MNVNKLQSAFEGSKVYLLIYLVCLISNVSATYVSWTTGHVNYFSLFGTVFTLFLFYAKSYIVYKKYNDIE